MCVDRARPSELGVARRTVMNKDAALQCSLQATIMGEKTMTKSKVNKAKARNGHAGLGVHESAVTARNQ